MRWNVWDHNDFLSFTADGICAGVDDHSYSSGKSLIDAHGGYLQRASFFHELARKAESAKGKGFKMHENGAAEGQIECAVLQLGPLARISLKPLAS
jgi:hypothetical protein